MTNQEAIKMLTAKVECMQRETSGTDIDCNLRNCDDCELCYAQGKTGEQREALNMAISALQEQRSCDTCKHSTVSKKWPCVDCDMREPADRWEPQEERALDTISRQDAIDEIRKCRFVVDAIEKIIDLPSAQPNLQPTCNQLATDTISRQEAIDALDCINGVEEVLRALPSAQPESLVKDTISRHDAIDALMEIMDRPRHADFLYTDEICKTLNELPSAQPEIIRCKDCEHFGVDRYNKLTWCSRNGYGYQADDFCSKAKRRTNGV